MKEQLLEPKLIAEAEIKKCEAAIFEKTGINYKLQISSTSIDTKTPEQLLNEVAKSLQMTYDDFTSISRKTEVVELRYLGIFFLKLYYPELTNKYIGSLYGDYHHSTIAIGHKKAIAFLDVQDKKFTTKLAIVKRALEKWLVGGNAT